MKKVAIIASIILVIALIGIYFAVKSNQNIDTLLKQFNNVQSDGFYDAKTNIEASGYIVSNKTTEGYRYGYVNYKGKLLLKAEYNQLYRVMDIENKDKIYIIAARNGRYGVSLNGKTIINYEYQFIEYDKATEKFILQKSGKYGAATLDGEVIIPVENNNIEAKGIYLYVTKNDENKVYNKNGQIKELDFNTMITPTENEDYYIKVIEENDTYLYGVINKEEKEIIPTIYTYVEYLNEDYFIVCNEKYSQGIVNQNNENKLEQKYNVVQKIQGTNMIMALDTENNKTELYSMNLQKICEIEEATVEVQNEGGKNIIKIYNKREARYFDSNGIEINK